MMYEIERDSALRAWEIYSETEGEMVCLGVMQRDDGKLCEVRLLKATIPDTLLKWLGDKGYLNRYIKGE